MNWSNLSDFLNMGGYSLYVWGSFGVTFFSMLLEFVLVIYQERKSKF